MGKLNRLSSLGIFIGALGVILLPLALPLFSNPSEPRRIDVELDNDERPTERYVEVTVRYYAARKGGTPIATELFHKIPVEDGTYTVHLGSSPTEDDAEWQTAEEEDVHTEGESAPEEGNPRDLHALMAKHGQLYYTVALTSQPAPTRRIPLDPDDLSHCVCG